MSDILLAFEEIVKQLSPNQVPQEIWERIWERLKLVDKPKSINPLSVHLIAQEMATYWHTQWTELNPEKATQEERYLRMWKDQVSSFSNDYDEGDGPGFGAIMQADSWIQMEEPGLNEKLIEGYKTERAVYTAQQMVNFAQSVGREVPQEIADFIRDNGSPGITREREV